MVVNNKKKSPYETALAAATKRLEKAKAEKVTTKEKLDALLVEIPTLERTIAVLQMQLNPREVVFTHHPIPGVINEVMASMPDGSPIPAEALEHALPQVLAEEDLLPEPEGQELLPE